MGGVAKLFGGGASVPKAPEVPDYEAEKKKAEEEGLAKRAALKDRGMAGAILGGSLGEDSAVKKKKLLGE
ncbi:hypothetical protein FACS1894206_09370 [Deltaproteobacteria bacterium]|nr:hypothetical protein FACS1894206_09370 [Deltaproteobacteria bacterium]